MRLISSAFNYNCTFLWLKSPSEHHTWEPFGNACLSNKSAAAASSRSHSVFSCKGDICTLHVEGGTVTNQNRIESQPLFTTTHIVRYRFASAQHIIFVCFGA